MRDRTGAKRQIGTTGALALLLACGPAGHSTPQGGPAKAEAAKTEEVKAVEPAKVEAKAVEPAKALEKPVLVAAPADGEVAAIVQAELARASGQLVVYVGATWCDPCKVFHDALVAGQLDRELAGVRFVEFDMDRDKERLADAGYVSRYIPLLAVPGPDGRASGRQIEGGIKGPGAATHILARLVPLLAGADNVR
jgi:thiol-disulfide isomerase/thioredoxin